MHGGVRTDRYNLIRSRESNKRILFDLECDSDETQSIYGLEGIYGVTTELKRELSRSQEIFVGTEPQEKV